MCLEVFNVKQSEISIIDALSMLDSFAPVKIIFNDIILYNDYDGAECGESSTWQDVLLSRLWRAKNYVVTDINIRVVSFHHAIVSMRGKYEPEKDKEL